MDSETKFSEDSVVRKIEALLRLMDSPNENEAALAAEKAQALLIKYQLSMEDIKVRGGEKDPVGEDKSQSSRSQYRRMVYNETAKLYFCTYLRAQKKGWKSKNTFGTVDVHYFVGTESNRTTARLMAEFFVKTIERECRKAKKSAPPSEKGSFSRTFKYYASARLCTRMKELRERRDLSNIPTGGTTLPALYSQEKARVDDWINSTYGELKPSKKQMTVKRDNWAGAAEGVACGDNIGLDVQISKKSSERVMLSKS